MFETISWNNRLPRWNLSVNTARATSLRKALAAKNILPLGKLCEMHAGDIVGEEPDKVDAFYAQCWAFAKFMYEAENGRYRPAMRKWIAEAAAGTIHDPTRSHHRAGGPWNRKGIRPMIEYYLGATVEEVDVAYQAYLRRIANEEFSSQWHS